MFDSIFKIIEWLLKNHFFISFFTTLSKLIFFITFYLNVIFLKYFNWHNISKIYL